MYPFHLPALQRRDHIAATAFAALIALVLVSACEEGTEPTAVGSRPDLATTAAATGSDEVTAQGRIDLPINQSIATTGTNPAFGVTQTGTGPDGVFKITRASNTQNALLGQTSGSGIAVRGLATSTGGRAGSFQISNAGNGQSALLGETNGTGRGVHGRATGSGIAGLFQVENTSNSSPAVLASSTGLGVGVIGLSTGTGRAGVFQISNPGSAAVALDVVTNGNGRAGVFLINRPSSAATALHAETNGGGEGSAAVRGVHTGPVGNAGVFQISNPTNEASALFAATSGSGWSGVFIPTSATGKGVLISTASNQPGLQVVGGTKNAVVATTNGARALYTEESSEVWFTDYGFGKLASGRARILIDPGFAETVSLDEPYHVFVQPYGRAELYVEERTNLGFVVQLKDGDPTAEFGYRVVAKRSGFERTRLERAPWADNSPGFQTHHE